MTRNLQQASNRKFVSARRHLQVAAATAPHHYQRECGNFCNHSSFNPIISVKGFIVMAVLNRLESMKAWLGLLWLGCALFSSSCANDEGSSADSSQYHRHHGGGGGRYGHGQGGMFDQSNPSGSSSTAPGE
jgi:hypothetical protein